jgi:hypothetical protein
MIAKSKTRLMAGKRAEGEICPVCKSSLGGEIPRSGTMSRTRACPENDHREQCHTHCSFNPLRSQAKRVNNPIEKRFVYFSRLI